MRILIAGAGIGGLTLAALLRQRGITPDIIDRAPNFDHAGYVLGLYPLGNRVLYGLSAFRAFATASESMDNYVVGAGSGREIRRFDFKPLIEKYGQFRILARGDLLRILHRAAGSPDIRMGVSIDTITDNDERVAVRLSDGSEAEYDLLVGADGIHSRVRKHVSPKTETFDTKWACWAWWGKFDEFPDETVFEQWGAGRFIGYYPTPSRIGMIAGAPERALGGAKNQGRKKRMIRAFARLKGRARDALAAFPEDDQELFYWKLEDRRARDWVKGRSVLLGDAACAFLPTAGIGASMAMESASVLAEELSRVNARDIPQALAFFEKRRRHRVEAAQADSRKLSKLMFMRNPIAAWARNQAMRYMSLESMAKDIVKMLDEPI